MNFDHFKGEPITFNGSGTRFSPFLIPSKTLREMDKVWGEMDKVYDSMTRAKAQADFKQECRTRIFRKYPQLFDYARFEPC